jgi:hypothetical protein
MKRIYASLGVCIPLFHRFRYPARSVCRHLLYAGAPLFRQFLEKFSGTPFPYPARARISFPVSWFR